VFQKRCIEKFQNFECVKCGTLNEVKIDLSHVDLMVKPTKCGKEECKSDRFKILETTSGKIYIYINIFYFYYLFLLKKILRQALKNIRK
jgi:hypothetical protein